MFPIEELEEIVEWKQLTTWQKWNVFIVPAAISVVIALIVSIMIAK